MLPLVEIVINRKDAALIGISPFFLEHGYYINPFSI